MAQSSSEIRFRIDGAERAQLEQIAQRVGMNPVDMVKVFIKRVIAAGEFPFDMRLPVTEAVAESRRELNVHHVSITYLSEVAARAAKDAHDTHIKAGRLAPSSKKPPS